MEKHLLATSLLVRKYVLLLIVILCSGISAVTAQTNLITNGNFNQPEGTGFTTDYNTPASIPSVTNPGTYDLATNPQLVNPNFDACTDHTTGTGNMLVIDGSTSSGNKVWQVVPGGGLPVSSGSVYIFSYWIESIDATGNPASLVLTYNGTTLAPMSGSATAPAATCSWQQVVYTFTATSGFAQLWLNDATTASSGNDFAIDDVSLIAVPPALAINYSVLNPTCPSSNNGAISVYGYGGYTPYTYSFNGGPYTANNIFSGLGTSTNNYVSIEDAMGTIVSSAHNINTTAPADPLSINPLSSTICAGTPVTLTASGGSTYSWTASPADPTLTTPNNAAITVTPTTTTTYTVATAPIAEVPNLIYNPGFESGNTGFSTGYDYFTTSTNQGSYGIGNSTFAYDNFFASMCGTHTGNDMMIVDGATTAGVQLWGQTIPVTPNQTYTFSYWIQSNDNTFPAQINSQINGTSLGTFTASTTPCNWQQVTYTWASGLNTSAQISLMDNNTSAPGNDFALDDISFSTSITCPVTDSVKVIVNSGTTVTGFSYTTPVCANGVNPTPIAIAGFTAGGVYSATPAGLTINAATGIVTLGTSTPGAYTVTYAVAASGCNPAGSSTTGLTITPVVTPVTVFSYTTPVCANGANPTPITVAGFTAGGAYSATPAGLTINAATGIITLGTSTPGAYTVTYAVAASGCNPAGSSTTGLTITPVVTPVTGFSYTTPVCANGANPTPTTVAGFTAGGTYSATPAGLTINAATGLITLASSTPGAYTITYAVAASGCNPAGSSTTGVAITPVVTPVTGFSYATPVCANGTNPTPTPVAGFTAGGTYSATPVGLTINAATGLITLASSTPGAYTITYAVAASGCNPAGSSTSGVTINSLPTATISGTATITSGTAATISFSGTPNATVTYTINGGANQTITLNASGTASVSTGNLTSNTTYALVSVTSAGVPACSQSQSGSAIITVTASPTATISGTTTICSGTAATISFNGTPNATVTYTINGGVNQTIVLDGTGNASLSTGNLTSNATYALVSASETVPTPGTNTLTGSATVTVKALPTAAVSGTTTICSNTSTNILFNGTPNATVTYTVNGGANQTIVLDGTGNASLPTGNLITSTTYKLGSVAYGGAPGCSQPMVGTALVTVNALPTATINGTTAVCSGTGTNITFNGTPTATVTYTINGGANQTIVLDGTGNATLPTGNLTSNTTYSLVSVVSSSTPACTQSQTGSAIVTVNALPTATINGATTVCSGSGTNILFNGTPNATVTYTINGGANQTVVLDATGTGTVATGALISTATYSLVNIINSGTPACSNAQTGSAVVAVQALPTALINGTATITSGTFTTIGFSGTPNATVTYTINGGANQTIVLDGTGNASLSTGNLTANTTYALVSVTGGGIPSCSQAQTGSAVITVVTGPTASISGTATICFGTSTNITFTGTPNATVTYTINGGANQTIVLNGTGNATLSTGNLNVTTTYTLVSASVTVPIFASNTLTGSATVTVNALPTATINGTTTICSGTGTTIGFSGTANATVTYTINGGANQTVTLDATGNAVLPTGNLTATTTYALVSVANAGSPSCVQPGSGTAMVTVNALPTATISGTTTICSNTATTISFSGTPNATVTYTINGGANQVITLDATGNAVLPTGNLTAATTYALVSVVSGGAPACSQVAIGTATVTVNALPTANISGTTTICSNTATTILFGGTPNATVTYTINGGANQTTTLNGLGTASVPTGNLTANTNYSLVSVANGGMLSCTQASTGTAVVTVNALPTAMINGTTTICSGTGTTISFNGTPNATVMFTINGGTNQAISLDATGNAVLPTGNLTATTTYALVSVANAGSPSCVQPASGSATVTVNALPTATISGTTTICSNTATTISFGGTPNATVTYTINGGANQVITLDATGNALLSTGSLISTTTYALVNVVSGGSPSCSQVAIGTATVTVNALPTANISGTTTICSNTAATISFSGTPNATVTYTINGGANQVITLDATGNASLPTGNLISTTTYALVSVANQGSVACVQPAIGTATVTVSALPTATINGATTICSNTTSTILFSGTPNATVTYTVNGGPNQSIALDGAGNAILPTGILNYTTTYALSGVTSAGTNCSQPQSGNAVVTVYAPPAISALDTLVDIDVNSYAQLNISVEPSPGDGFSLVWSPTQNIDASDSLSVLVNPSVNTVYTVTASSTSVPNCSSSVSIDVVVLPPVEIPNVFSPNGDGLHDTWYIKNLEQYPNAEVSVFNRYGQFLFESQGNYTEHQWDGTYNGSPVPIGTYYYIVKLNSGTTADAKPLCGWVAVLR